MFFFNSIVHQYLYMSVSRKEKHILFFFLDLSFKFAHVWELHFIYIHTVYVHWTEKRNKMLLAEYVSLFSTAISILKIELKIL